MQTSPSDSPSAGTSFMSSSTTRIRSETIVPTPWRARSAACSSCGQLVPVGVPGADGDRPVGLREPVEVRHVQVETGGLLEQRRRRRRAADEHLRGRLERARLLGGHDRGQHGRRRAQVGHALGRERAPDRLRLHLRQAHVLCAGRGDRPRVRPAVAVEHRQRPQVGAARRQAGLGDHAERVQVGAAVVGHDALRAARGAGRVVDREQRALVLGPLQVDGLGVRDQRLVVGDHPRGVEQLGQLGIGEHELRAGVLEDVGVVVAREARVERHQHRADAGHRVVQLEHRDARSAAASPRGRRARPRARFSAPASRRIRSWCSA